MANRSDFFNAGAYAASILAEIAEGAESVGFDEESAFLIALEVMRAQIDGENREWLVEHMRKRGEVGARWFGKGKKHE